MDTPETANRRLRLRELVDKCFNGTLADVLRHIKSRTDKGTSQSELSGLLIAKSFGERKAAKLADDIGLHRKWFEMPSGTNLDISEWMKDAPTEVDAGLDPLICRSFALGCKRCGNVTHKSFVELEMQDKINCTSCGFLINIADYYPTSILKAFLESIGRAGFSIRDK